MKKRVWCLLLLMVPLSGAVNIIKTEDFEEFAVGELPSQDWYTASFGGNIVCDVQNEPVTGSKALRSHITSTTGSKGCSMLMKEFHPVNSLTYSVHISSSNLELIGNGVLSGSNSIITMFQAYSNGDVRDLNPGSTPGALVFTNTECPDPIRIWHISLNWTSQVAQFQVSSPTNNVPCAVFERNFKQQSDSLRAITLSRAAGALGTGYFDNVIVDTGIEDSSNEENQPAEFEAGLKKALGAIGFKTPESEMLFAIILIGIATIGLAAATRMLSPGRLKNGIITGISMVLGLFALGLFNLEPWMFVVSVVLGIATVTGGGSVRNTFHELRDKIAADITQLGITARGSEASDNGTPEQRNSAAELEPDHEPPAIEAASESEPSSEGGDES